jgi:hypothetical protein
MTQRFLEDGRVARVTGLAAGPCPVTAHGPASSTVTRSTRPSSVNRWVIPSFLARMAGMVG